MDYELNARVEGEHFQVEFESKEAAVATKEAINDAGYHAGVYVEHGV